MKTDLEFRSVATDEKIERRITLKDIAELRVENNSAGLPTIRGYAAVFNSESRMMKTPSGRTFKERIIPGAFRAELESEAETKATIQHDPDNFIARKSKGTLRMKEDKRGLYVEITPPDTTLGRDTVEQVKRGDLDKMSFAFVGAEDTWERMSDGSYLRTLSAIRGLKDVTLTDRPAYEDTEVAVRMADEQAAAIEKRTTPAPVVKLKDMTPEQRKAFQVECERLMGSGAELRYVIEVNCESIAYQADAVTQYSQTLRRYMESLIRMIEGLDGALAASDQRALDDCIDELQNLAAKNRATRAALTTVGADPAAATATSEGSGAGGEASMKEDDDEEDDDLEEASFSEEAAKAHRAKMLAGTFKMNDLDALLDANAKRKPVAAK